MWHSFYEHNPLLSLPLFAMAAFMIGFVIVTVRAWRRAPAQTVDAAMPLDDDSHSARATNAANTAASTARTNATSTVTRWSEP